MLRKRGHDRAASEHDHVSPLFPLHAPDSRRIDLWQDARVLPADLLQSPGEDQLVSLIDPHGHLAERGRPARWIMRVRGCFRIVQSMWPVCLEQLVSSPTQ